MNEAHCRRNPGHRRTRARGQGTKAQLCVRQVVAAALRQAVAHGGGSSWGRRQLEAQVARSRELRWLGREEDEVKLEKPSPPSLYKLLGSRTVTWHISL